jgi:D-amino-acid dehydrogenase
VHLTYNFNLALFKVVLILSQEDGRSPPAGPSGHDLRMASATCDAAVVGGGLVGAALAFELASAGASVVLIDRHDRGRATDAGAGILSPDTSPRVDAAWHRFASAAGAHYPALVGRLAAEGITDTGYDRCGLLSIVRQEHEDPWFEEFAAVALARAPGVAAEIDGDEARRRFPPLGQVWRALYHPGAARVDGRRMLAALAAAAEGLGVTRWEAGAERLATRGSRVVGVITDHGELSCDSVVVAGGAWSREMESQLGTTIPVEPLKGQIIHLSLPGTDTGDWPILQPLLGFYLVPWADGRVACGGTLEPDAGFDTRPTAAGVRDLLRECLSTAPGLGGATVVEVRVGLRPEPTDGLPVLGRLPGWDNAYVATGHGTEGLLLGPYSAAMVGRTMTGAGDDDALEPFAATRLAR